jgi:hypothetical protein
MRYFGPGPKVLTPLFPLPTGLVARLHTAGESCFVRNQFFRFPCVAGRFWSVRLLGY